MMLENYQQQRQASTNLYGQDLAQQHQAFKEQLANQMQQAYVKELPNYMKEPGGAQFASQMPGMASTIGVDPSAWAGLAQAGDIAQGATNLKNAGTGFNQLSQAGLPPDTSAVPAMTGVNVGPYQGPALLQAARERANASMAVAAAGRNKPQLTTVVTHGPADATGASTDYTSKVPMSQLDVAQQAHNRQVQATMSGRTGGGATSLQPNPNAPQGDGTTTQQTQPSTQQTKPIRPPPTGSVQLDTNSALGKLAQNGAMQMMERARQAAAAGDPAARAMVDDVNRAMKGPVYTTARVPNGPVVVRGASGHEYAVAPGS
jgi:hypothetical protein